MLGGGVGERERFVCMYSLPSLCSLVKSLFRPPIPLFVPIWPIPSSAQSGVCGPDVQVLSNTPDHMHEDSCMGQTEASPLPFCSRLSSLTFSWAVFYC